jgi:phosphoglycolate phosphatase-like HAD superfamily hydrolase
MFTNTPESTPLPIRAILFDFDGVILESMDIKTVAFVKLFSDYPDQVDRIRDLHIQNGGTSRFIKFRMIYRDILKQPLSEERFQDLCDRYSELVFQEMMECPFVPGAKEFLDRYAGRCPFFLITGTPQPEIEAILFKRGLTPYFTRVFGYPPAKEESVRIILEERGFDPRELVFLGDALSDLKGARANGVPFIGRISTAGFNPFEGERVETLVDNLFEFEALVGRRIPRKND